MTSTEHIEPIEAEEPIDAISAVPIDQEEVDSRSVYVGNVDYQSTPEQLENFFNKVGTINRITILFDRYTGFPKGYAYVEFELKESVQKAIDLNGEEFRGRELRVTAKRTNVPGLTKRRGGGRGDFRGGRARGAFRGGRGEFRGGRARGAFRGRGRGRSEEGEETIGSAQTSSEPIATE